MTELPRLAQIWYYPVKSLPGIRVKSALAGLRGLEGDRRFMLCDQDNRFISVRQRKELYRFNVAISHDMLVISHPDEPTPCRLNLNPVHGEELQVTVWDDVVSAIEPDKMVSQWFSNLLGEEIKLVYMPADSERIIGKRWHTGRDLVSFADGYAYLVTGKSSLDDVSEKTGLQPDPRRFRPNLVIDGTPEYEEFFWKEIIVGGVKFSALKPCERCVVTTIDPDSGIAGKEPLQMLAGRKIDGKVVFGQHASVQSDGIIHEGDAVQILLRKESPYDPL
ncbi:MOSC domain-containing protein [Fulvivirga sedimenti]|uniref:MOSC domain-containing protein n=1 Tax=Fulvivirga sedimenti TaxID=2879465 RepID=A0A9X1L2D0_9BACT|nr:MOSC N-terminal beta barrel domain-containing protein [Fulvivirga sedimenti]MCA6078046.1 MOSC domain-containing protein [Fulvivirga sedimenti]